MNYLLFLFLFMAAVGIGCLICNDRKIRISCQRSGDRFTIYYDQRVINIELTSRVRIPSYTWVGKVETIVIPKHSGSLEQIELFMTRYKTSRLAEALFRFSEGARAWPIIRFDPEYSKELIGIQMRLKCFIKDR